MSLGSQGAESAFMRKRTNWGLIGALTHAILSGRLWKSAAGSGCALCGEHRRGEMFLVLYDYEICRTCVERAASFFQGGVEGPGATAAKSVSGCVECGGPDAVGEALFDGAKGSICRTCTETPQRVFVGRCTR